jgi:competence protein ComGC/acetyltransferase-like isoleucine patch superfamily enzyme
MKCFVSGSGIRRNTTGGTEKKQGFILLPLLLFLMVCSSLVLCFIRNVYQESEVAREHLRRKQMETIAQSFMFTAIQQEKDTEITGAEYSLRPLQPGNSIVQVSVSVNRVEDLGMRFLKVKVSDSGPDDFSLRQFSMCFPVSLLQQFTGSPLIVTGSTRNGKSEKKDKDTITGKSYGAAFPQFSVKEIAGWASTDFPPALELQSDGLSGWIYLSRNKIELPKGWQVNGDGVLAFADDVTIGDNTVFTGRVIVLAGRDLRIGSHVRLNKALLLCRGKLTVGTDSIINGAVMTQQDAVVDENALITGDREVLEPFNSIISY